MDDVLEKCDSDSAPCEGPSEQLSCCLHDWFIWQAFVVPFLKERNIAASRPAVSRLQLPPHDLVIGSKGNSNR